MKSKHSTNRVAAKERESSSTDDEAMVVGHTLSATSRERWIVNCRATCHKTMCNSKTSFSELHPLFRPQEVMLGDEHILKATAEGPVMIETQRSAGYKTCCKLSLAVKGIKSRKMYQIQSLRV